MSAIAVRMAVRLSRELPAADVRVLADALRIGPQGLSALHTAAAGVRLRAACTELLATQLAPEERHLVAGALLGALESDPRVGSLDVVWTGPASQVATSRLTSSVVVELIDEARIDLLLVGYAVHTEQSVAAALGRAQKREVMITLLLERHVDNPGFSAVAVPFPGLPALRLAWPAPARPAGASLHAKVLVVDGTAALIGSANVTGAALERNLECGLLVRGGSRPAAVRAHVHSLVDLDVLRPY